MTNPREEEKEEWPRIEDWKDGCISIRLRELTITVDKEQAQALSDALLSVLEQPEYTPSPWVDSPAYDKLEGVYERIYEGEQSGD